MATEYSGILILKNSLASIQDSGRKKFRQYGIPVSGTMDQLSAWRANKLIGNDFEDPVVEIFYTGFKCRFNCDQFIAVTGAAKGIMINGENRSAQFVHKINQGDELEIRDLGEGFISYLSFSGIFAIEKTLDSYSTNTVSNFGGLNGRYLQKGDFVPIIERPRTFEKGSLPKYIFQFSDPIRFIEGPDYQLLNENSKNELVSQAYSVLSDSNRMGYRLSGDDLVFSEKVALPSRVTVPGIIQLTNNHQLIVIMKDGQTTGGYPRLGAIIAADLDRFAQHKPGDKISFQKISYQEAIGALIEYKKLF